LASYRISDFDYLITTNITVLRPINAPLGDICYNRENRIALLTASAV